MKKILLKLYILCCSFAWSADSEYSEPKEFTNLNGTFKPEVSSEMGIGRVERDPMYYVFIYDDNGGPYRRSQSFGVHNHNARGGNYTSLVGNSSEYPIVSGHLGGINARTVTNDIRCALLDKEYFDTLLIEGDYFKAYQLCSENVQGQLWKRQVMATLKKDINTLTLRSTLLQDEILDAQITTLIDSFSDVTEIHSELTILYNATKQKATARRNSLLDNPQVAALAGSLQQDFINLMFGDFK